MSGRTARRSATYLVATLILAASLGLRSKAFGQPSPPAAEPPINGWFELVPATPDGKTPFVVHGWALATCGPVEVRVNVDGGTTWRGSPSIAWPGIAESHPGVEGAERAGFWSQVDPSRFVEGEHRLDVAVEACGQTTTLGGAGFETAPPTPAWIAWPILALVLLILPSAAGRFLARREVERSTIPGLELRVALLLAAAIATIVAARHVGNSVLEIDGGLFAPLANWDGRTYIHLATEGYSPEQPAGYAFLPLYPVLLSAVSIVPLPMPLLGSLLNAGLFLLLVVLLRRLYPERDDGIAVFACLPFACFFVATYTEPLALALAAGFVLALRRNRPGWAFGLGMLAGLTRITCLPLAFFALDFARRRRLKPAAIAVLGPSTGLAVWMFWLWRTTGDPLKFLRAQAEFGRATSFDAGRLLDVLWAGATSGNFQTGWELGSLFLVLVAAATLIFKGRWGEGAYAAAIVLMPLVTLRLVSLNRYALSAFPAVILLGGLIGNRIAFRIVLGLELALLFFYAARFGQQYWVG